MAQPNRSLTERGFTTYDEFRDTNGALVTVRESSAVMVIGAPERDGALAPQAEGRFVWVFTDGNSAHLTMEMATRLRDALDTFIREQGA